MPALSRTLLRRASPILAVLLGFAACRTGSPNTLAGAATMTALGVGAAAVSRANGGCIAICTAGTFCNTNTGLCERHECGDVNCGPNERCERTYNSSQCVSATMGVAARADGGTATVPLAPVIQAPPSTSGGPTIVPAAEQPKK